jgi:hypothetical protein
MSVMKSFSLALLLLVSLPCALGEKRLVLIDQDAPVLADRTRCP